MFDFQTKEPQTNMTQTTHHENCKKQASNPTPDEPMNQKQNHTKPRLQKLKQKRATLTLHFTEQSTNKLCMLLYCIKIKIKIKEYIYKHS